MNFNKNCTFVAVVSMMLAWIPAFAGMTGLRDFMVKKHACKGLLFLFVITCSAHAAEDSLSFIDTQIAAHPQQSGIYVLDTGEDALVARAWLADHAQTSALRSGQGLHTDFAGRQVRLFLVCA